MAKPRHHPPAQRQTASAAAAAVSPLMHQQVVTTQVQQYSGQIPHPDLLRSFDDLLPGTAKRLIQWAEEEQNHRRRLESEAQAANIDAQQRQISIAQYQSRGVFRSDIVGQVFGLVVCLSCISGAVLLALNGQPTVAGALTIIPTGAVIYAFRGHLFAKKP